MAAPRKYSDEQRAAIFARAELGVTPAQIAHECAAGLASCAPFQIPRRTAQQIVADMRRERGPGQPRSFADLESAEAIRGYPLRVLRIVGEDSRPHRGQGIAHGRRPRADEEGARRGARGDGSSCAIHRRPAPPHPLPHRRRTGGAPAAGRLGAVADRRSAHARGGELIREAEAGEEALEDPGEERSSATHTPASEAKTQRHDDRVPDDAPRLEPEFAAFGRAVRRGATAEELQPILSDAIRCYQRSGRRTRSEPRAWLRCPPTDPRDRSGPTRPRDEDRDPYERVAALDWHPDPKTRRSPSSTHPTRSRRAGAGGSPLPRLPAAGAEWPLSRRSRFRSARSPPRVQLVEGKVGDHHPAVRGRVVKRAH